MRPILTLSLALFLIGSCSNSYVEDGVVIDLGNLQIGNKNIQEEPQALKSPVLGIEGVEDPEAIKSILVGFLPKSIPAAVVDIEDPNLEGLSEFIKTNLSNFTVIKLPSKSNIVSVKAPEGESFLAVFGTRSVVEENEDGDYIFTTFTSDINDRKSTLTWIGLGKDKEGNLKYTSDAIIGQVRVHLDPLFCDSNLYRPANSCPINKQVEFEGEKIFDVSTTDFNGRVLSKKNISAVGRQASLDFSIFGTRLKIDTGGEGHVEEGPVEQRDFSKEDVQSLGCTVGYNEIRLAGDTTFSCKRDDDGDNFGNREDLDDDGNGLIEIRDYAGLLGIPDGSPDVSIGFSLEVITERGSVETLTTGCPVTKCTGYELTADINAPRRDPFTPIRDPFTPIEDFSGMFDGKGFTINNLVIMDVQNRSDADPGGRASGRDNAKRGFTGFFAKIKGGTVKNLIFDNFSLTAKNIVGLLRQTVKVGFLAGAITNTATVSGVRVTNSTLKVPTDANDEYLVGGIVGENAGTINGINVVQGATFVGGTAEKTVAGATRGGYTFGGIAGSNTGTVEYNIVFPPTIFERFPSDAKMGYLVGVNESAGVVKNNRYPDDTIPDIGTNNNTNTDDVSGNKSDSGLEL